jgi:hypothetical protein
LIWQFFRGRSSGREAAMAAFDRISSGIPDLDAALDHIRLGGKACGMLLARKIIENQRPDLYARLEPHDSFYIGSDVFYSYIVENGY